jgi:hypothetical protein
VAGGATAAPPVVIGARNSTTTGGGVGAKLTRWHGFFDLPAALAPALYQLAVSNGGPFVDVCTFVDPATPCLGTVNVTAPPVWDKTVFAVDAEQPGVGRNATAAVQAAVDAAGKNGGGVVYFAPGQYFVTGAIRVPVGVVLKGDSADLVAIYFAEDSPATAPAAYLTSTTPGRWGIEGLTFYVTSFAHNIVQFTPGTDGAFMRRCRIRFVHPCAFMCVWCACSCVCVWCVCPRHAPAQFASILFSAFFF